MINNFIDSNPTSISLKNQNNSDLQEKKEPLINVLSKLNSIANENFHQIIPPIVCEICYKANNLLICEICQSGFHKACLGTAFLPERFICSYCRQHFTDDEILAIINQIYTQAKSHRKALIDNNKKPKDLEHKKNISSINQITNPTTIINLEEEENSSKKSSIKEEAKGIRSIDDKDSKECIDNKKNTKNFHKKNSKDKKKIKEKEKAGLEKDKDNSSDKQKINKSINNIKNNNEGRNQKMNRSYSFKNLNKNNKKITDNSQEENSGKHQLILSNKKRSSKSELIEETKKGKDYNLLLSFTHTDPQYKRRKIKIGTNRQCNMYEFTDKYENKINFEEEEHERNDLIQVWSVEKNPLSSEELDKYIRTARLFWNYRNIHIEEDLCADFFHECEQKMKSKKIASKLKNKIIKLIKELKELIKRGIDLNSHYDEMSLRILHLCKYKTNVALIFLYKGLNPFIEEVEEGFKHDIYFFQDEIYSFINNGDFFDSDD